MVSSNMVGCLERFIKEILVVTLCGQLFIIPCLQRQPSDQDACALTTASSYRSFGLAP